MFEIHREELDWGGRKLVLETGKIARQADGAVFASYGETTVLATVVAAKKPKEGIDLYLAVAQSSAEAWCIRCIRRLTAAGRAGRPCPAAQGQNAMARIAGCCDSVEPHSPLPTLPCKREGQGRGRG